MDVYFLERGETPLGPNGKPDFESLNALDIKLFDSQISKLPNTKKVLKIKYLKQFFLSLSVNL